MIPSNAMTASRLFLEPVLGQAGCVIDATAGNGHDLLFLCRNTRPGCRIYAFDIQSAALQSCASLLEQHDLRERVSLINSDHANLTEYVREPVDAVIFNLGYLPGQDHTLTTNPLSLRSALEGLIGMLAPGGLIAIVAYPGHEPGRMEVEFLESYLGSLPQSFYTIIRLSFINQRNNPAILYSIGKTRGNQHEDSSSVQSEGNRGKTGHQNPG